MEILGGAIQTLTGFAWCKTDNIEVIQNIVSTIILIIEIAVPILLIIFGMLDLGKAVVASKEDEIKKSQQTFVKRLISAALVFLVIFVVKLVINVVASAGATGTADIGKENGNFWDCADRFISGPDKLKK